MTIDPPLPRLPLPSAQIRALLRATDRAALATAQRDAGGWPYASLVLLAIDHDAAPLLLISGLADHTKNLLEDSRASLLIDGTGGLDEPLTGPRATVMGRAAKIGDDDEGRRMRARFLARHPSAELYAGFGDFALWRLSIERAHLVAGFGNIHWVDGTEVHWRAGRPLEAQEAGAVAHMNTDHADAVALYAKALLGLEGDGWILTGVDGEGADLRLGGRVARLPFDKPVEDADGARVELVRLVKRARAGA